MRQTISIACATLLTAVFAAVAADAQSTLASVQGTVRTSSTPWFPAHRSESRTQRPVRVEPPSPTRPATTASRA